jgi:MFS family permease
MATTNFIPSVLRTLSRDGWLLLITRFARLFAYGSLSVILVFYLIGLGLTETQAGLVLTLTLVGDVIVSLYLTTRADRIGRRRMLIVGSILMAAAGLAFASTRDLFFLVIAGTIGVISPSGNEVGPFLSIEQAALSHIIPAAARTEVFAWYTLAGSLATAFGALCGGALTQALEHTAMTPVQSYRAVVFLYAALGIGLAFLFTRLSTLVEVDAVANGPASSPSVAHVFGICPLSSSLPGPPHAGIPVRRIPLWMM